MAARFTVYCQNSVADLTPDQLLDGVQEVDLLTIAEDTVPEDRIEEALEQLRIENDDANGFRLWRLRFGPHSMRPIDIDRWQSPGEVQAVIGEVLDELEATKAPKRAIIRSHLLKVVDIVDASYGSSPGQEMAPILASEVVRWLAQRYCGIVRDGDEWWHLGRFGEYQRL